MIGRKEWDQWNKITAEYNERKQKEESPMKKCPICTGEIENKKDEYCAGDSCYPEDLYDGEESE